MRQSQVNRERTREQLQIAANQNRARIPTRTLVALESLSDDILELTVSDSTESVEHRAWARWKLDWRRAYGYSYEWDEKTATLCVRQRD